MATTIYKFYGESKWAKFQKPDEKYGHYGLDLIMDAKSWAKFKKSGLQLKVKECEEGKFVSLRRQDAKLIKGELVQFGRPEVVDNVGRPFDELIGNGSKVAVEVAVYDTQKGKGHRLEKVIVEEHVPFNRIEDAHDDMDEDDDGDVGPGPDIKQDDMPF